MHVLQLCVCQPSVEAVLAEHDSTLHSLTSQFRGGRKIGVSPIGNDSKTYAKHMTKNYRPYLVVKALHD